MRRSNWAFSLARRFSRAAASSGRLRGELHARPGELHQAGIDERDFQALLLETDGIRFNFGLAEGEVLLAALGCVTVADLDVFQRVLVRESDGFPGSVPDLVGDSADARFIPVGARPQRQCAGGAGRRQKLSSGHGSIVLRGGGDGVGVVGTGGFEPPTCRLGGDRSIHLSYVPTIFLL